MRARLEKMQQYNCFMEKLGYFTTGQVAARNWNHAPPAESPADDALVRTVGQHEVIEDCPACRLAWAIGAFVKFHAGL